MQPSRRAFLFGRRAPPTPWDAFRQRLGRLVQGRLEDRGADRALLAAADAADVRHARALCAEYGIVLALAPVDGAALLAGRPALVVDPAGLVGLQALGGGRWRVQPGCQVAALAAAGLAQFGAAPPGQTLAGWLAGASGWPPGATAVAGVLEVDVLLADGTAETLGPFGLSDVQPLRSATVQRLVPALFQLAASPDAAACRQQAHWPGRYRLDALLPEVPAGVNLAQLLCGHGGTLAWLEQAILVAADPPARAIEPVIESAAKSGAIGAAARRLDARIKMLFDPQLRFPELPEAAPAAPV